MKLEYKKLKQSLVTIRDSETGYKKEVFVKKYEMPNGLVQTFFVDRGRNSVCIFAITDEDQVILVKQFRPGPEKVQLEIPGGGMHFNEDPKLAAKRELLEETGYEGDLEYISSVPYSPYSSGMRICYMATNCQKVSRPDLDPNEFVNVVIMNLDEFRMKIRKAEIRGFDVAYIGLERLNKLV